MLRRSLLVLVAAALLSVGAPAYAATPTTETTTERGVVETFVDVLPTCEEDAPAYTITTTSNRISHETTFPDGRVHATFTDTGTFVAVPLEAGMPTYRGKFTVWGGFNANGKTVATTFTFNLRGTGSGGAALSIHQVEHLDQRPDGTEHQFFRCH